MAANTQMVEIEKEIETALANLAPKCLVIRDIELTGDGYKALWVDDQISQYLDLLCKIPAPSAVYLCKSILDDQEQFDTLTEAVASGVASAEERLSEYKKYRGTTFHITVQYLFDGVLHEYEQTAPWYEFLYEDLDDDEPGDSYWSSNRLVERRSISTLVESDEFVMASVQERGILASRFFRDQSGPVVDGVSEYEALQEANEKADEILRASVKAEAAKGLNKSEIRAMFGISSERVNYFLSPPRPALVRTSPAEQSSATE